jgi:hypothetical protein
LFAADINFRHASAILIITLFRTRPKSHFTDGEIIISWKSQSDQLPTNSPSNGFSSYDVHLFGLLGTIRSIVSYLGSFYFFPATKDKGRTRMTVRASAPIWNKLYFIGVLIHRNTPYKTLLLLFLLLLCCRRRLLPQVFFSRYLPFWTALASSYSISRIMLDVPSTAIFFGESVECFPGMAYKFFVTLPVVPVITGIITYLIFHIRSVSLLIT